MNRTSGQQGKPTSKGKGSLPSELAEALDESREDIEKGRIEDVASVLDSARLQVKSYFARRTARKAG